MALPRSGITVPRKKIAGMEGPWVKMWDPPADSPATPDRLAPTNPVPGFMRDTVENFTVTTSNTVQRNLRGNLDLDTWDGAQRLAFMTFSDPDGGGVDHWPGPTIRVPRGVVFHAHTKANGGPHTIHWHGIEPTPMNDGVGHCSMELGEYTYQWQPNFIGTYFYHCHRNTVQHFEFGLYGMLLIEPPDAYDPTISINDFFDDTEPKNVGGYPRRTAANLANFSRFPGFVPGDPVFGVGNAADDGVGHPHAFTIPYDVECLWVADDRDSNWSNLASSHFSFYPAGSNSYNADALVDDPAGQLLDLQGGVIPFPTRPGVDDVFFKGFFHDYNADYWFVTGVPVPAHRGGEAVIDPAGTPPGQIDPDTGENGKGGGLPNGEIPAILNGGVSGMRVDVRAQVNQTVLVRVLNAAYNTIRVTFPVDVVIIAFDGRALGVPPFGRYNRAFTLPAGTPFTMSTARRFDALIRESKPVNGRATIEFFDASGFGVREDDEVRLMTARIPINITEPDD